MKIQNTPHWEARVDAKQENPSVLQASYISLYTSPEYNHCSTCSSSKNYTDKKIPPAKQLKLLSAAQVLTDVREATQLHLLFSRSTGGQWEIQKTRSWNKDKDLAADTKPRAFGTPKPMNCTSYGIKFFFFLAFPPKLKKSLEFF